MTNVGFEPTPFQTSALNWRLRPLGQLIIRNGLLAKHHHTNAYIRAQRLVSDHQTTRSKVGQLITLQHASILTKVAANA